MGVDTAVFMRSWLEREHPGTVWDVVLEPAQHRVAPEPLAWKVGRADTDRVDDQEVGVAA